MKVLTLEQITQITQITKLSFTKRNKSKKNNLKGKITVPNSSNKSNPNKS